MFCQMHRFYSTGWQEVVEICVKVLTQWLHSELEKESYHDEGSHGTL
jgi:hypothetical protein